MRRNTTFQIRRKHAVSRYSIHKWCLLLAHGSSHDGACAVCGRCLALMFLSTHSGFLPLSLLQLPALFRKDLHGCDRDGRPVSQGKVLPPTIKGFVVGLNTAKGLVVCPRTQSPSTTKGVYLRRWSCRAFAESPIVPPSPHSGRPRRRCEALCAC